MKTLELKHLMPYLPYGLHVNSNHAGKLINNGLLIGIDLINGVHVGDSKQDYFTNIIFIKPILRPLSDLSTENITEELSGKMSDAISEWVAYFNSDAANKDYAILTAPYPVIEWCFENNFDVYSLIPNRLAIDINTLSD